MKENILDKVANLLKSNSKYVTDDGELLKAKVYSDIMTMNEDLLKLLLSDEDIKKTFFTNINGTLVFDKQKFAWLIDSKEFLPDSYTAYTNKIGLTSNNDFISNKNDVVLDFPYKDCILEGGQTKDDQNRKEIFYNETLAQDEIRRMLDPKVFTNAKRYTKDGVEEGITFNEDDNLIIKGNNLIALASLLKRYEGQVKCIYIDPPYNTGSDSFNYNDNFNHSSWLTFMKNRLELAKKLLRNDGVIFVQCDDNEQAYLKVLMDDIFENCFLNCIAVKMSEATGVKMSHSNLRFPKLKEYLLFYAMPDFSGFDKIDKYRAETWDDENNIFLENFSLNDREFLRKYEEAEVISEEELCELNSLLKKAKKISLKDKLSEMELKDEKKNDWLFKNSYRIIKTAGSTSLTKRVLQLKNIPKQDIAAQTSSSGGVFFYITDFNRKTNQPRLRVIFADTNIYKNPGDFWQDIKTTGGISNEGGVQLLNGKKPEKILSRIIKMTTKVKDLVLDFHLGSGTTAAVAHKMGRKYVGIEQMDYIEEKVVTRLKRVLVGEQTGISKAVNWQGGGSFVYCELKENAQELIDSIQACDETNIKEIKEKIYNDDRIIPYLTKNELLNTDKDFEELSLEDKKKALITLVDKNKLYVNYSDIDNKDYEISEEERRFSKSFYEVK